MMISSFSSKIDERHFKCEIVGGKVYIVNNGNHDWGLFKDCVDEETAEFNEDTIDPSVIQGLDGESVETFKDLVFNPGELRFGVLALMMYLSGKQDLYIDPERLCMMYATAKLVGVDHEELNTGRKFFKAVEDCAAHIAHDNQDIGLLMLKKSHELDGMAQVGGRMKEMIGNGSVHIWELACKWKEYGKFFVVSGA